MSRGSFQPGRGPTVLTIVAVVAFGALGLWQLDRNEWRKRDLATKAARSALAELPVEEALRDPAGHAFRPVVARGRFELADTIIVGPAERGRELGARVLTPLALDGAAPDAPRVLVDRGFVPEAEIARFLPGETAKGEPIAVRGLALELALRDAKPGARERRHTHFPRFNPDRPGIVAKINAQLPYALAPLLVQSSQPEAGGLPIGELARPASPVDHFGYALTWFAVAALSLAAWVEYGRRRAREEAERRAA